MSVATMPSGPPRRLKELSRDELTDFVVANVKHLLEEEALAILDNPFVTTKVCQLIGQNQRLTGFYSVRLKLVALRQTPQAHATKLVFYLFWPDLVRLSVDVTVPAAVRRAVDTQLLLRVEKLTLGERIASARRCSQALIKVLLFDPDPKVFAALLVNQLLREDDLVHFASSPDAQPEQIRLLADDRKWSHRYAIRKALVMNPVTPRSVAAAQLRYLRAADRRMIHGRPDTSVYLRRCIEGLEEKD
ncbi:MAG: hypothetical protein JOZ54_11900 [Acidobacteria bacterium]|nr:hypothetical protein [Acidobacteriota bacterium]